jgi:hypothetical protein
MQNDIVMENKPLCPPHEFYFKYIYVYLHVQVTGTFGQLMLRTGDFGNLPVCSEQCCCLLIVNFKSYQERTLDIKCVLFFFRTCLNVFQSDINI